MSHTIGLRLTALDVLFFRDGRPFSPATRGESGLPQPQTLAGALRTALLRAAGCDFERFRSHADFATAVIASCPIEFHGLGGLAVHGPWLARPDAKRPNGIDVLVPAPAILQVRKKQEDGKLYRLLPLAEQALPGWRREQNDGLRPLWLRDRIAVEPAAGYLTSDGLQAFLDHADMTADALVKRSDLFDLDHRTGIGIEPNRQSAQESAIYGASFLALKDSVSLYAELVLPEESLNRLLHEQSTIPFGGEGRRVSVEVLSKPIPPPWSTRSGKPLLLLTTPGLFSAGWRPAALTSSTLTAAAVPGATAVSGWDLARSGPKPTRFAALPGSVYFLDSLPHDLPPDSLCDDVEDRCQGWGCYVKGVWNDG